MQKLSMATMAFQLLKRVNNMPLNEKGKKIKAAMKKEYGAKNGKEVFYASENKGTIKGVTKKKK